MEKQPLARFVIRLSEEDAAALAKAARTCDISANMLASALIHQALVDMHAPGVDKSTDCTDPDYIQI